jgi:thiol-disulfide isomerase/thioredoxin
MIGLLSRLGGVLSRPRRTLAALRPGEGASDGLALLLLYTVGAKLEPLARGVASFQASAGAAAALGLALSVVAFLPWALCGLGVELALGRGRSVASELLKAPLVVCAAAAVLLDHLGAPLPGPDYLPELLGGAISVALALWVRPVTPRAGEDAARTDAQPASGRGRAWLGGLALALIAVAGIADARVIRARWSTMAPVGVGEGAPSFRAPLLEGGEFSEASLADAPHLLVFWTTWCGVCAQEMPMIAAMSRRYAARGLRVVAINADAGAAADPSRRALVEAYQRAHEMPAAGLRIAMDEGSARAAFRVRVFPHSVLIGRGGQIRHMFQGRTFESTLAGAIEEVLAGGGER